MSLFTPSALFLAMKQSCSGGFRGTVEALRMSTETATELKIRGNKLFDREEYKAAEHMFSAALLLEQTVPLYANRALSRIRQAKWEEALDDCRQVLSMDPRHAKAHARMGRCYFELGQFVEAEKAYNMAAEIDPDLKELQSRWRLDSALNKIAKTKDPPAVLKAKQQSKSGFAAPLPEENDPEARAMWEMWTAACKANPVFLQGSEQEDESVTLALMLKPRLTSDEARQDAQQAYNAGDLIINRNEELSSAYDLVSEYSGDPPSLRLIPLFVTKDTVFLWNGKSWRYFSVALFDNCLFVKKIGHFLLSEFFTWYNGMTHRGHHYIALEKRSEKKEILALVFSVKEEFTKMLELMKEVKPKN